MTDKRLRNVDKKVIKKCRFALFPFVRIDGFRNIMPSHQGKKT